MYLHYQFYTGSCGARVWTEVSNICDHNVGIEYISSFSLVNVCGGEIDKLWIPHNSWMREADWKGYTLLELGLDKTSAISTTTKRISFPNTGTWSTKEFLPIAAVECKNETLIWQIENNGSWQWELGDIVNALYLKTSGPTENENHWHKELKPGEVFTGVATGVAVGDSLNGAISALTVYRRNIVRKNSSDAKLPVIFNDYMCIRADPTTEKMIPIIDKAAQAGAEYYCMDAGWYTIGGWWGKVGE